MNNPIEQRRADLAQQIAAAEGEMNNLTSADRRALIAAADERLDAATEEIARLRRKAIPQSLRPSFNLLRTPEYNNLAPTLTELRISILNLMERGRLKPVDLQQFLLDIVQEAEASRQQAAYNSEHNVAVQEAEANRRALAAELQELKRGLARYAYNPTRQELPAYILPHRLPTLWGRRCFQPAPDQPALPTMHRRFLLLLPACCAARLHRRRAAPAYAACCPAR